MAMESLETNVTRGKGVLEGFLAKKRGLKANQLIPASHRDGRIADVGCGSHPHFLLHTPFREKYGFDKVVDENYHQRFLDENIRFSHFDVEKNESIPFEEGYFDVVTLLAVFEHLEKEALEKLLGEIHRILKSGGLFIMTTPAFWTKSLLKGMAKLKLVSPVEIGEHKNHYTPSQITSFLEKGNFRKGKIECGHFEFFMNTWALARK